MLCLVRAQILGRILLPSTLALPFHIALVFLRVSASLRQGAYSHTVKREAVIAGLASEGLALLLGSAEAGKCGCAAFGFFSFFPFFFKKRISVALFKLWVVHDYSNFGTPCPRDRFHHLGLSPMRPNELWTCPRDGAAMA